MESTLLTRRRRLSTWSSYGDQTTEPGPSRPRRVSSETQDAPGLPAPDRSSGAVAHESLQSSRVRSAIADVPSIRSGGAC